MSFIIESLSEFAPCFRPKRFRSRLEIENALGSVGYVCYNHPSGEVWIYPDTGRVVKITEVEDDLGILYA